MRRVSVQLVMSVAKVLASGSRDPFDLRKRFLGTSLHGRGPFATYVTWWSVALMFALGLLLAHWLCGE